MKKNILLTLFIILSIIGCNSTEDSIITIDTHIDINVDNFTDSLKDSAEVIKRLPELPKIMDKANQALTFMASGQIPQNSNSYSALKEKELEMKSFRNQSIIGLLLLVFLGIIVF